MYNRSILIITRRISYYDIIGINMIENKTLPEETSDTSSKLETTNQNVPGKKLWLVILIAVLLLGGFIAGIVLLLGAEPETAGQIRDIFIIVMAMEFLVIGVALIILIIQIAILTNLMQNEVRPILTSTQDTVNTLKGTVRFLSNNVSEPVIKLNEYLAGFKKLLDILKLTK